MEIIETIRAHRQNVDQGLDVVCESFAFINELTVAWWIAKMIREKNKAFSDTQNPVIRTGAVFTEINRQHECTPTDEVKAETVWALDVILELERNEMTIDDIMWIEQDEHGHFNGIDYQEIHVDPNGESTTMGDVVTGWLGLIELFKNAKS